MRRLIELLVLSLAPLACHDLNPRQQAAVDLYECRVRALAPYVEGVDDAADVVRGFGRGTVKLTEMLLSLGWLPADIVKAATEFRACEPPLVAEPVVATPPAYGNKIVLR